MDPNKSRSTKTSTAFGASSLLLIAFIFFTSIANAQSTAGTAAANFIGSDAVSQGNWQGKYGTDGSSIANSAPNVPSYATLALQNPSRWTWANSTTDPRALQSVSGAGRTATTWYNAPAFSFDVNLTDGKSHQIALYALDWDSNARGETIQIADANSGTVLDTQRASNFSSGVYFVWNISGHVKINVTLTSGWNAVVSGIFFGGASPTTATLVSIDAATQGNWQGKYGTDGSSIANSAPNVPSYATLALQNPSRWTWANSTTDPRALQSVSGAGRTATTWYNAPAFSFDVNLTDGKSHQIALYALDWDSNARGETIQIADANSGTVLDTQRASNFSSGVYFVWNISGHVKINVTLTSGWNAVVSGIFFGGASQNSGTPPTQPGGQGYLSVSPMSFNFGSVNIGSNVTQTFTVSNSGTATVTFSNVTLAGAGLTATGVPNGLMLSPGQSATSSVAYAPAASLPLSGSVTFTSDASDSSVVVGLTGAGVQPPPPTHNTATFLGTDTTTQGAWKGLGNFNIYPPSSSFVYGKDGEILPDTEGCDSCNPFPSYVSFGPQGVNSSTPGNLGAKPYRTHAYVDMVQGSGAMGAEPQNTSNTKYFQCNLTFSNAAIPWAPMVAWTPAVDTREISQWYTCTSGIFYLELTFAGAHNFEIYVVDDPNGGTRIRTEKIQVLDGDTDAVLYDSGDFTNFTSGVYYRWTITGHVKVQVINRSTTGTNAVINGVFFN